MKKKKKKKATNTWLLVQPTWAQTFYQVVQDKFQNTTRHRRESNLSSLFISSAHTCWKLISPLYSYQAHTPTENWWKERSLSYKSSTFFNTHPLAYEEILANKVRIYCTELLRCQVEFLPNWKARLPARHSMGCFAAESPIRDRRLVKFICSMCKKNTYDEFHVENVLEITRS